ncbi:hypothetical protein HanPSC8_Chr02g0063891 [Helianthus annuus]|nr:hypothetical protein HanHA89_Chr02g0056761 [Helianthus annuus]KAJ0777172.1 hypothetical protein HanLR1_Chr02g0054341 [Helianthus annuus]KAJ0951737.1 hypothetical protein HanPSC8_Chr02g0063891 [Helianthus annuus]
MHLSYPSHSNRRNSERSSQLAEKTHTPFSIPHNIRFEYFVTSPETEKTTGVTKDIAELELHRKRPKFPSPRHTFRIIASLVILDCSKSYSCVT